MLVSYLLGSGLLRSLLGNRLLSRDLAPFMAGLTTFLAAGLLVAVYIADFLGDLVAFFAAGFLAAYVVHREKYMFVMTHKSSL